MTNNSEPVAEELPPFSFLKKPIRSFYQPSAFSLILAKTPSPDKRIQHKPSCNNINYDEQIRAPRMLAATHYTYQPEPRGFPEPAQAPELAPQQEASAQAANPTTTPLETPPAHGAAGAEAGTPQEAYLPAILDISQPTRRNLEPVRAARGLISTAMLLLVATLPTDADAVAGSPPLDATVLLMQLKLLRAMDNLASNTTTAERTERPPNEREDSRRYDRPGPGLQQVYDLKKPLCMPAVLRPSADDEDSLDLEVSTPLLSMQECPFELPEDGGEVDAVEPTHAHWKPDSLTDHCMKCFEVFGSFFNPQRKRRHHCRFCGFLFCHSCLYKSKENVVFDVVPQQAPLRAYSGLSNGSLQLMLSISSGAEDHASGVAMDLRARLAVPIFRNLTPDQPLRPRFKVCKACKTCGHNYQRLMYVLNHRAHTKGDISTPYVFIENPYLSANGPLRPVITRNESFREERLALITVPSDWTWSSF